MLYEVITHWGDGTIMDSSHPDLVVANSQNEGVVVTEHVLGESAGLTLQNTVCVSDAPSDAVMDCFSPDVNAAAIFSFTTEQMVDLVVSYNFV